MAQEVLQKLSTTEIILLVWEKQPEIIFLCPMVKHPLMNHLAAAQSEVWADKRRKTDWSFAWPVAMVYQWAIWNINSTNEVLFDALLERQEKWNITL